MSLATNDKYSSCTTDNKIWISDTIQGTTEYRNSMYEKSQICFLVITHSGFCFYVNMILHVLTALGMRSSSFTHSILTVKINVSAQMLRLRP